MSDIFRSTDKNNQTKASSKLHEVINLYKDCKFIEEVVNAALSVHKTADFSLNFVKE